MKKVINITLGSMVFFIEEDAYTKLQAYLDGIKRHFSKFPDHEEIIADMESRIAEHFQTAVGDDKATAITIKNVDTLIHTLGTVQDFTQEEKSSGDEDKEAPKGTRVHSRKLYRNPDDTVLGGVCSGIASYIGIDPVIVRLAFILLTFAGGFMILLYIILWIIVPEATSATEKMEMQGDPITLASIDEALKKTVQSKRNTSKVRRLLSIPVTVLSTILSFVRTTLIPILGRVIGAGISIGSAIAGIVVTFIFVILLFNINSPYIDFPLKGVVTGITYYALISTAFLVIFLPLLLILVTGSSLLAWRNTFSKPVVWSIFGIWVVALFAVGSIALRISPEVHQAVMERPENQTQTKEFSVQGFTSIEAGRSDTIKITKGNEFKVVATGNQEELQRLTATVENGVLSISHERITDTGFKICLFCFRYGKRTEIEIQMPELSKIQLSGASNATITGFNGSELTVDLSGASRGYVQDSTYDKVRAELSGASRLTLEGQGQSVAALLTGSSQVHAHDFPISNGSLELHGASTAYIRADQTLSVLAHGASRVYVQGKAKITSELHGASRIFPEDREVDIEPIEPVPSLEEGSIRLNAR